VDAPASGLRPPPGEAGPAPGFWTRGAEQGVAADSPAALADCGVVLCVGALDGLWLFDGERATRLSSASGALPSDWVTAIASDGAAIWAGTFESGVARIGLLPSIRTNVRAFSSVRRYAPSDGLPEGRVQPQAALVREGALYAATPRGLLVVRGDEAALVPMGEVTALAPAARGFWIGARGEVARIAVHFGGGVL
jgi:ligand-binding sensor domain-containing protein